MPRWIRTLTTTAGALFLSVFFIYFFVDCSSAPKLVDKVEEGAPLPDELADQFEILAHSQPTPEGARPPKTEPKKKKTTPKNQPKAKKKKKEKKEAFVIPNRRPSFEPLWVGEKVTLEITYFGVVAGLVDLEVLPFKTVNDRKVYHLKASAKSSKLFSVFYRLDDKIESFLDFAGMFSHRFHLVLDESKQSRDSLELYDSRKRKTYYWDRWNHYKKGFREKKEYHDIEPFPQDSLSSLYYVRGLPLPTGAQYEFPVVTEGKTWRLLVKVVRREMLDTKPLGRIQTIVLKPETKFDGKIKQKGDSYIWLSDDRRRYVVRVEAKVKVGTIAAVLEGVQPGSPP